MLASPTSKLGFFTPSFCFLIPNNGFHTRNLGFLNGLGLGSWHEPGAGADPKGGWSGGGWARGPRLLQVRVPSHPDQPEQTRTNPDELGPTRKKTDEQTVAVSVKIKVSRGSDEVCETDFNRFGYRLFVWVCSGWSGLVRVCAGSRG